MSWYKVRHPFSCCEGIVRKPFAGTLWMNQATCSCPKQKRLWKPNSRLVHQDHKDGKATYIRTFRKPCCHKWHKLHSINQLLTLPPASSPLSALHHGRVSKLPVTLGWGNAPRQLDIPRFEEVQWQLRQLLRSTMVPWEQHCVHHSCSGKILDGWEVVVTGCIQKFLEIFQRLDGFFPHLSCHKKPPTQQSAVSARSRKDCCRLKSGRSLIRRLRRAKRAMGCRKVPG